MRYSLFHLINHSFFKCLLFIGSGFIIHALSNEQDLRKLGGLFKILPYIYVLILFASFALMGLPYFSGFYSKEKILESSFYIFNNINFLSFWLGTFSALFTSIYSIKLLYLSFFNYPNNQKNNYFIHFHFENKLYLNCLISFLGLGSIFSGYFLSDLIIGTSSDFFLYHYNNINYYSLDFHLGMPLTNLLALFFTIFGVFISLFIFNDFIFDLFLFILSPFLIRLDLIYLKKSYIQFYNFFSNRWYINYIYNRFIGLIFLKIGYLFSFKLIDQGYILYGLGQSFFFNLIKQKLELSKIYSTNLINELFFMFFINFFIYILILNIDIVNIIFDNFIKLNIDFYFSLYTSSLLFFFAVPKKKKVKKKSKKMNIFSFLSQKMYIFFKENEKMPFFFKKYWGKK